MLRQTLLLLLFLLLGLVIIGAVTASDNNMNSNSSTLSKSTSSKIAITGAGAKIIAAKYIKTKNLRGYSGLYPYKRTYSTSPYLFHILTGDRDPNKRINYYGKILYKIGDIEVSKYGTKIIQYRVQYMGRYRTFFTRNQISVHINMIAGSGRYSENYKYYTSYKEITQLSKWAILNKLTGFSYINASRFNLIHQPKVSYCGPTCLRMVESFYGINRSIESLAGELGTNPYSGTKQNMMISVFRKHGLNAKAIGLSNWTTIYKYYLSKGPLILYIRSYAGNIGHYVVLVGINFNTKEALISDPAYGYKRVPLSDLKERMNWIVSKKITTKPIIAVGR